MKSEISQRNRIIAFGRSAIAKLTAEAVSPDNILKLSLNFLCQLERSCCFANSPHPAPKQARWGFWTVWVITVDMALLFSITSNTQARLSPPCYTLICNFLKIFSTPLNKSAINVAPPPVFSWLNGLNNGMLCRVEMLSCVFIF